MVPSNYLRFLIVAGAAACGSDASEPAGAAGKVDAGGSGGPSIPCEPMDAPSLDGTWAVLARYSLQLRSQAGGVVTMCPEDQSAPSDLIILMEIESAGEQLSVSATPCQLDLPSVSAMVGDCRPEQGNLLTVSIPIPAALESSWGNIPPVAVEGELAAGALMLNRMRFTWGTRTESLPVWQDDREGCGFSDFDIGRTSACEPDCVDRCDDIVDDDADSYPGVTVHVCGTTPDDVASNVPCNAEDPTSPGVTLQGRVSMTFRTELEFEGEALSSCEATGTFASDTTYAVVGADAYLANTKVSVSSALQSLPLFDGDAEKSVWRMVRVDGEHGAPDWGLPVGDAAARCAIARAKRNELE